MSHEISITQSGISLVDIIQRYPSVVESEGEEVVPEFFDRGPNGIPKLWINRIRHNFATLPGQFNTTRMVREYVEKYYR